MNFEQTGLPDQPVFRDAFTAGWEKYPTLFSEGDSDSAASRYLCGPVAMARLILTHGGDCRQMAAAACLAGPAAFSDMPFEGISPRLSEFVAEIRQATAVGLYASIPNFSGDARVFFQATAILLLEQIADLAMSRDMDDKTRAHFYREAINIYQLSRGEHDTYHFDTRFELAARKASAMLDVEGISETRAKLFAS